MDKSDTPRSRKSRLWITIPKILFLYALVPLLLLKLLAQPVGEAVRLSDAAALWITLAALGAVGVNWLVYVMIHRKRPSLLVFAHGVLCLLIIVIIQHEVLPVSGALTSTLALAGGYLAMAFLLLLSFWFASRESRPAHAAAVGLWIVLGVVLFAMAYRIIRDIESRRVSRDTWITAGSFAVLFLALNGRKILSAFRRAALRRRMTGLAAGTIVQIVGETHLDRDDDLVTRYHARVQFTVGEAVHETRASISKFNTRRYGRDAFIGLTVPVFFNPADPAEAYAKRIDRHIFDQ